MATITVNAGGSIQAAIDAANPGDTIDVAAGTYNDQFLTIEKSLTLQAVGGEVVMTEDQSPPNGKAMITEGQPGLSVAINGFDISGVSVHRKTLSSSKRADCCQ
jgi:nitrous oxidase accessory protein NosD